MNLVFGVVSEINGVISIFELFWGLKRISNDRRVFNNKNGKIIIVFIFENYFDKILLINDNYLRIFFISIFEMRVGIVIFWEEFRIFIV